MKFMTIKISILIKLWQSRKKIPKKIFLKKLLQTVDIIKNKC